METFERLAVAVLGPWKDGWLRRGAERVTIARIKLGAAAAGMVAEVAALNRDTARLRAAGGLGAAVQAAAYYHVRFENIHPLRNGNGRVGRIILTGQMYQSGGISPAVFEQRLTARQLDYRRAFAAADSVETWRQLTLLLGELVQVRIEPPSLPPDLSLEPLHRSPGRPN